jgi:hypothetical protein
MTLPKELKDAISQLSSKDKDKLIFRLLKKDLALANQLLFELVSVENVEEKRAQVKKQLSNFIEHATIRFYSPGWLNMDVREMSGIINEHVTITKDKYGEAYLNLWMITEILERNKEKILSASIGKTEKFCMAVIARAFKILLLIKKLHEDYRVEFEDDLMKLGRLIGENKYLMKFAIYNGFDVNWLITAEIPENLEEIHKDLRDRGYLK